MKQQTKIGYPPSMNPLSPYLDWKGKTIISQNGHSKGIVISVHMRHCMACGYAPCCSVRWDLDNSLTKPCVRGIKENPDGTLSIM